MKNLTLKQIAFIPLAIVIVWGFSFSIVTAQTPTLENSFVPFITSNFAGTNAVVTFTSTYMQIQLIGVTQGGVSIGTPFYIQQFSAHYFRDRTFKIDYEYTATAGTCALRPTYSAINGLNGTTAYTLLASEGRNTRTFTWSLLNESGQLALSFYRYAATCDATIKIYSIKDSYDRVLWSPSSGSGSSVSIDTTEIENRIDSINTSLVLFFLFALTFLGYTTIINIRKN